MIELGTPTSVSEKSKAEEEESEGKEENEELVMEKTEKKSISHYRKFLDALPSSKDDDKNRIKTNDIIISNSDHINHNSMSLNLEWLTLTLRFEDTMLFRTTSEKVKVAYFSYSLPTPFGTEQRPKGAQNDSLGHVASLAIAHKTKLRGRAGQRLQKTTSFFHPSHALKTNKGGKA